MTSPGRFEKIVAVGAGRMGLGIAVAHAMAGQPVTLVDFKPRRIEEFAARRDALLVELAAVGEQLVDLGLRPAHARPLADLVDIVPLDRADAVLGEADLVYEGVPETREAKADALGRIAEAAPTAVIASTTSTMLASELAELVTAPERFCNAHWLNPAYISPLVEVSSHEGTDAAIVDALCETLTAIDKVPVRMKSSPGYIVPRLQALIMNEAARMVEEGVATPEEIDRATRFGLGYRFAALGVLEFIDFGGADTLYQACEQMSQSIDADRYRRPLVLDELMADGEEGLRSGRGFFEYPADERDAYRADVLARTVAMVRSVRGLPEPGLRSATRFRTDETKPPAEAH